MSQQSHRICDEGISHLKTQINYSFPANEQPPGSCGSRHTASAWEALRIPLVTPPLSQAGSDPTTAPGGPLSPGAAHAALHSASINEIGPASCGKSQPRRLAWEARGSCAERLHRGLGSREPPSTHSLPRAPSSSSHHCPSGPQPGAGRLLERRFPGPALDTLWGSAWAPHFP